MNRISHSPKRITLMLALAAVALVALIMFAALPRAAESHAYYYYGTRLTGGAVHVEWSSSEVDALYKDLSPTDLDNYARRVYLEIDNGHSVNCCDELTAYTRSNTVSVYYKFTKNNEGIDKSWISTRNHRLTLYDASGNTVEPNAAGGASHNDSDCYLTNTYNSLPDGKYKLEAYFWQGHGVHSTQFQNRFYYTQYIVVDTAAPSLARSAEYAKASAYATFSDALSPVTATYSRSGAAALPYASGKVLTDEGRYTVTATDAAGNVSSVAFTVDRTPPVLSRSGEYAKASAYATFSDALSPVTATYSLNGAAALPYTSGQTLTGEGKYTVTATDAAGNVSSVAFIVDRTPPVLNVSAEITRSGVDVTFPNAGANESPVTVEYTLNGVYGGTLRSGASFTAEGEYIFTATDAAGNTAAVSAVVDKTAPVIRFTTDGPVEGYTAERFVADAYDTLSGLSALYVLDANGWTAYDGAPRSDNGLYRFRAVDRAGNAAEAELVLYRTDTFGNSEVIRNGYKLNAWYTVALPARIFTTPTKNDAGRYSFESYDAALAFAVAKEREYRVTPVQGGYMYVSATNEAVTQKYTAEETLAAAVEKYAKGYISARRTADVDGNDKYYTEPESLTRNAPALPKFLAAYDALPRYFARASVTWSLPDIPYIKTMPYTVTARYLGDISGVGDNAEFVIPRGATLSAAAQDSDGYRQGWYLVTESDAAGNVERYLVYSDAESPTARVAAVDGDGSRSVTLDLEYTKNETLYFLSLCFERLSDNADAFVTLKIQKGNTAKYYTQADALPTLGADEYASGKYTVTVFDRSLNALTFDVYIAGAPPTMTHGSLAADKADCRIAFNVSDRYNVITEITLYKFEHDGSKSVLDTDGLGVAVSPATLTYTLTVGGKYGATVKDNYRRTLELEPIFFLKGLPSGRLSGVKDGGRTNKNVSFTFSASDTCEIYTLHPNGERRPFTGYSVQTGSTETTYHISANDDTSHEYLVFLHNATDRSLYVEYTFEIDTVLPFFEITDSSGNVVEPDGATNKPFSIEWNETGVSVRYYTARSGSLGATKYGMNTVLSQGTLYYFTLRDDVGNMFEFTVLLDNSVDYALGGKYTAADGVYYARAPLSFTVNEPTVRFDVANADGHTIENGGTLTREGEYEITVEDNYGNVVVIRLVLDFTPPTVELSGASSGGTVNNAVTVVASGYDSLYLADRLGNKLEDVKNGETFSYPGSYYITASDRAGNTVTVSFTIDLSVDYTLSVPNGAVTTQPVTLDTAEPLDVATVKDGGVIDTPTRFTDSGVYELTLTDALGNSVSCVFVILPQRARTVSQSLPVGTRIVSIAKDGAAIEFSDAGLLLLDMTGAYTVSLDCGGVPFVLELEVDNTPPAVTITKDGYAVKIAAADKDDVTLELTADGKRISCNIGKTLDAPGHYVLVVTDELGNVAVYEFDIPYRLNTWGIVAVCVGAAVLLAAVILAIRARRKPRMK